MLRAILLFGALLASASHLSLPGAPSLAVHDVTVIPMTGAPPLEHATVLIRNGRIAAIGPSADVDVPAKATVVEGTGRFLDGRARDDSICLDRVCEV